MAVLSHPMESHNGGKRRASAPRWFELEPPAPERLRLETTPRVSTVASYVFTRAAERSWEVLNQHLAEPQRGRVLDWRPGRMRQDAFP